MLHGLPELHRHADRDDGDECPVTVGVRTLGARRSTPAVTAIASGAKFVPQRGEKRLGRTSPFQAAASERDSAAAIARCSAPWRRSVRPRKSQRTISVVVSSPAGSSRRLGNATKKNGARSTSKRKRRSRRPATPRPRASGAIDAASCSRPRTSGIRIAAVRRIGNSPSCSSPAFVAKPSSARPRSRRRSGEPYRRVSAGSLRDLHG